MRLLLLLLLLAEMLLLRLLGEVHFCCWRLNCYVGCRWSGCCRCQKNWCGWGWWNCLFILVSDANCLSSTAVLTGSLAKCKHSASDIAIFAAKSAFRAATVSAAATASRAAVGAEAASGRSAAGRAAAGRAATGLQLLVLCPLLLLELLLLLFEWQLLLVELLVQLRRLQLHLV